MSELDKCIDKWGEAVAQFEESMLVYHEHETRFKSWEAAIKMAHMRNKASGVMADCLVKTHEDWESRYLNVQKLSVKAETAKRVLRLAEAAWETERSKEVTLRNIK